jgi:hypothetical protein
MAASDASENYRCAFVTSDDFEGASRQRLDHPERAPADAAGSSRPGRRRAVELGVRLVTADAHVTIFARSDVLYDDVSSVLQLKGHR